MPEIFLISDTHFGHSKILDFEPSRRKLGSNIEEHDEALIERWNKAVRPKDTVWHLGDVAFSADKLQCVGRLNGIKKLVMGNHDTYNASKYAKYFQDIKGAYKMDGLLLTHIPIHPDEKYRFAGNVHGHLHGRNLEDPFYCNVSCEQIDYQPAPLYLIRQSYNVTG